MRNLELKAVAADLARLRQVLRALGAKRQPRVLHQTDWYFSVPRGRVKLRQRRGDRTAELVCYLRADATRARASEYQKLTVADPRGLLRLLRAMFTPDVCVRKRRDLWLYGTTRVHLDRVVGLGSFVEIEVPFTRQATSARRVMQTLVDRLGIADGDRLACSYADLQAGRGARPVSAGSPTRGRMRQGEHR